MSYSPHRDRDYDRRDPRDHRTADPYRGGGGSGDVRRPDEQICGDFQRGNCFRSSCRFAHILKNGSGGLPAAMPPMSMSMSRPPNINLADVCKDFQRGRCSRGQGCRYAHLAPGGVGGGGQFDPFPFGGGGGGGGAPNYAAYAAAYGANPFFPTNAPFPSYFGAGGHPHPQALPSFPPHHAPFAAPFPSPANVELCRDFKHGACSRGEQCRFAHLRERCADFQRGKCDRGQECRYSHDKPAGPPCRDFQKGLCSRGELCRYSHEQEQQQHPRSPQIQTCRDYTRGNCDRGDNCKYGHVKAERSRERDRESKEGGGGSQGQTSVSRQDSKENDGMPGMSRKRTRDEDDLSSSHSDDHHLNHAHMSRNNSREQPNNNNSLTTVDEHHHDQPPHQQHQEHKEEEPVRDGEQQQQGHEHENGHEQNEDQEAHQRPPKQIKRVHSADQEDEETHETQG